MAAIPEGFRSEPADISEWESQAKSAKRWHLLATEDVQDEQLRRGTRIYGQFTPQEFTHTLGAKIPDASGLSRTNPLVQWVGGNVETISFQARLFSQNAKDQTATQKFELLKKLRKVQDPLNRPPIMRFFWGTAIPGGMLCFVESLGGVKYDEIRPDGSIRGVSLQITLKKFQPFRIEQVTASPTERTPTHVTKHGETYELIAYRRWGDPMLGIPLRQQNPRFPMEKWAPRHYSDLSANEIVKLYPRRDLDSTPIRPTSHIFDENNQIAADNRRYYFDLRGLKIAMVAKR